MADDTAVAMQHIEELRRLPVAHQAGIGELLDQLSTRITQIAERETSQSPLVDRKPQELDNFYARLVLPVDIHGAEAGQTCRLFPDFRTAANVLRMSHQRGELHSDVAREGPTSMIAFFSMLDQVDRCLSWGRADSPKPFVVAIEGLDGTGKSTLVDRLAKQLHGAACRTPPASMDAVRQVFDRRGGIVSRAFYMVSNYVLQHEIRKQAESAGSAAQPIFVVDRWYASTCAYSIGWKTTTGGADSVDVLDESLFRWPRDLDPPELMLVLRIDDAARRARVQRRGLDCKADNPWDERLDSDAALGQRIYRAFQRVRGPRVTAELDAGGSEEEVAAQALQMARLHQRRLHEPWHAFCTQPMHFFRWVSSREGLCDQRTGTRAHHAPWAFQLALSDPAGGCPSHRSVGIHTADDAGVLFFTWGHPGGGRGGGGDGGGSCAASLVCVLGQYPREQQWRAEGVLCGAGSEECQLLDALPPSSLVRHISACHSAEAASLPPASGRPGQRKPAAAAHQAAPAGVHGALPPSNSSPLRQQPALLTATRFVPLRMEVLLGGPSSPGGPRRFEWWRERDAGKMSAGLAWEACREILPFSAPGAVADHVPRALRHVTLAVTGMHCAGKTTVGRRVAKVMGWRWESELGDVLRGEERRGVNGHQQRWDGGGGGGGEDGGEAGGRGWDEQVHCAECERDKAAASSRVVETWHVGNLAWALSRGDVEGGEKTARGRARSAVEAEGGRAVVMMVHLSITAEDAVRRRREDEENAERLKMEDAQGECARLHAFVHRQAQEEAERVARELGLPILVLENVKDGEQATEQIVRKVVRFVLEHQWLRAGGNGGQRQC